MTELRLQGISLKFVAGSGSVLDMSTRNSRENKQLRRLARLEHKLRVAEDEDLTPVASYGTCETTGDWAPLFEGICARGWRKIFRWEVAVKEATA